MLCLDTDLGVLGSGGNAALFARKPYTGNGATGQKITNNINGGLIWTKNQDNAGTPHVLFDSVRGVNKSLQPASTSAEGSISGISAFYADGFQLAGNANCNDSGFGFSSFAWVEQAGYMDVVTYTGNGSNRTIAHNLGSTPKFMIVKSLSSAGSWAIYHASNTASPETDYLLFDGNATADDNTYWNDAAPTSSVFSVGTNVNVNSNGVTYVAYLFAESAGSSKFDSYTGTGTTTLQSINTGFEPSIVFVKGTAGTDWHLLQTGGNSFVINSTDPQFSSALARCSVSATGFNVGTGGNNTKGDLNNNGDSFVYCAWKGV